MILWKSLAESFSRDTATNFQACANQLRKLMYGDVEAALNEPPCNIMFPSSSFQTSPTEKDGTAGSNPKQYRLFSCFPVSSHGGSGKRAPPLRLCGSLSLAAEGADGSGGLGPLLLQGLLQNHVLHLSKTLVQISTNSSKMTLLGRRVVTINLVERWLIHPNPGPVMSPLCQFSHPF